MVPRISFSLESQEVNCCTDKGSEAVKYPCRIASDSICDVTENAQQLPQEPGTKKRFDNMVRCEQIERVEKAYHDLAW